MVKYTTKYILLWEAFPMISFPVAMVTCYSHLFNLGHPAHPKVTLRVPCVSKRTQQLVHLFCLQKKKKEITGLMGNTDKTICNLNYAMDNSVLKSIKVFLGYDLVVDIVSSWNKKLQHRCQVINCKFSLFAFIV